MNNAIVINPQSKKTKFVAIDADDKSNIIAEGRTIESVIRKAERTGRDLSLMFVPQPGQKYVL